MKKLVLAGAALSMFLGGSVMAADLGVREPAPVYRAPPPVAYFTWTGCYVGGNVGGLWVRKEWIDQTPGDPFFGQGLGTHTVNSWLGGAQAGCDYQVGGWVFGIQGDYDWTNAQGSNANTLFPLLTNSSQIKSLASVTGRVGYAWDRFLGYVKGGGAWEQDNYNVLRAGASVASVSDTRSGWTVGVGGEYAFTNWLSGFVEYDYYDFGTRSNLFTCAVAVCGGLPPAINITETKNVVKVGLNLRWGPSSRW